jgi:hypothetical protein
MLVIAVAGIKVTARIQVGMAVIEYILLIGFGIAGLVAVLLHRHGTIPLSQGWLSLGGIGGKGSAASGFLVAVFMFTGWDGTLYVNEEVTNRYRNPGRAAIAAVAVLSVIYTLCTAGLQGTVPAKALQDNAASALVYTAQAIGGGWAKAMAFALALSVIATTGTGIVLSARIIYGMASRRVLPPVLGNVSARFLTPVAASVLAGVLIIGLTWVYLLAASVQDAFIDVVDVTGLLGPGQDAQRGPGRAGLVPGRDRRRRGGGAAGRAGLPAAGILLAAEGKRRQQALSPHMGLRGARPLPGGRLSSSLRLWPVRHACPPGNRRAEAGTRYGHVELRRRSAVSPSRDGGRRPRSAPSKYRRVRHGLVLALPRGPCSAHWPPRSLLARNSSHARRPPGDVPFRNTITTSGITTTADFRAIRAVQRSRRSATASPTAAAAAAVTTQPSAETGDSPQPSCLGPNQAFQPTNGLVLTGRQQANLRTATAHASKTGPPDSGFRSPGPPGSPARLPAGQPEVPA